MKVWLPQAFIVGDRYVSRKTTTRRFTHASKLQRTSWGDIRHDQSTQQANRDRYARNPVYRLKYKRFS